MSINRYNPRRDVNELEIVNALKQVGCTVIRSNAVDLIVGYKGVNYLMEIKCDHKAYLKPSQIKLMAEWEGQYAIVTTITEAMSVINIKGESL